MYIGDDEDIRYYLGRAAEIVVGIRGDPRQVAIALSQHSEQKLEEIQHSVLYRCQDPARIFFKLPDMELARSYMGQAKKDFPQYSFKLRTPRLH